MAKRAVRAHTNCSVYLPREQFVSIESVSEINTYLFSRSRFAQEIIQNESYTIVLVADKSNLPAVAPSREEVQVNGARVLPAFLRGSEIRWLKWAANGLASAREIFIRAK